MLGYSSCSWFLLVVETVSQQHTHTHWLWVCHLVQLLCPSFMVCLSNNVFKLFCLDTHLAAVYLLTLYQSVSSARLSSAQTREGRNVMWRGGRDHTRGAPRRAWSDGGRQGGGEVGGVRQFLLSTQTNTIYTIWAKGDSKLITVGQHRGVHRHAWAHRRMRGLNRLLMFELHTRNL